ncbi:hypothetical protein TSUD_243910 [Trifolium subterraneum]|uniref:Uncharacterized protein n=1 Tax=Trifolium subterraneum TaxID=3900 RepID=A0A2Z6P2N3_TRISU|nr:hypothetical protein TSUD_243910 [Trifolium subterraneum]
MVWIRLLNLPQEYWRPRLLFEIVNGIGTPLLLDDATKKRPTASVIDLEKKNEHQDNIFRVDGDVPVMRVTEDETPTDDSPDKIFSHPANEILKETDEDDATITDLERQNDNLIIVLMRKSWKRK